MHVRNANANGTQTEHKLNTKRIFFVVWARLSLIEHCVFLVRFARAFLFFHSAVYYKLSDWWKINDMGGNLNPTVKN